MTLLGFFFGGSCQWGDFVLHFFNCGGDVMVLIKQLSKVSVACFQFMNFPGQFWELGTGNWELGTGNWELGTGNVNRGVRQPCETPLSLLRKIQTIL